MRIRGAAGMLCPIEVPPVGYNLVPMSNAEDGVDDALLAEPIIEEDFVPAMNGSRPERCGESTLAERSGGGPSKVSQLFGLI